MVWNTVLEAISRSSSRSGDMRDKINLDETRRETKHKKRSGEREGEEKEKVNI